MRSLWDIAFSDLIVILGIIITIGLAVIILWAEITIKRRWDTLYLTDREYQRFYDEILERMQKEEIRIFSYGNRYYVSIIKREGNLAAGKIFTNKDNTGSSTECGLSERKKQELSPEDMVLFDYRHAVPLPRKPEEDEEKRVIVPHSAILAKLKFPE